MPVSNQFPTTGVNCAQGNNQHPKVRGAQPHRATSRIPSAERRGNFQAIDNGADRGNSLENAVRVARLARDRLLVASREEQHIYRTLISAEVALRDAGALATEDRVPYRGRDAIVSAAPPADDKELDGGGPRTLGRGTWMDPAAAASASQVSPHKGETDDAVGLRAVLEQVHANVSSGIRILA